MQSGLVRLVGRDRPVTLLAMLVEFAWSAPLLAILLGAARPSLPGALAMYTAAWAAIRLGAGFGATAGTAAAAAAALGAGLVTYRTTASGTAAVLILLSTVAIGVRLAAVNRSLADGGQPAGPAVPAAGITAALALYRLAPAYWPTEWGHPACFAAAAALFGALLLAEQAAAPSGREPPVRGGRRRRLAGLLALGLATAGTAGILLILLTPSTAGTILSALGSLLGRAVWYLGAAFFYAFRWVARLRPASRPGSDEGGDLAGEALPDLPPVEPMETPESLAVILGLAAALAVGILLLLVLRRMLPSNSAAGGWDGPAEDVSPLDDQPLPWGRAVRRWWREWTGAVDRDPDPQVERVRAAFRQVLAGWARAGRPRAPVETPAEFTRRVGRPPTDPETAAALEELRRLYERARYGRAAGKTEADQAEALAVQARPRR